MSNVKVREMLLKALHVVVLGEHTHGHGHSHINAGVLLK